MNGIEDFLSRVPIWRILALFAGCTAAPVVEDYPERAIDRPFTLPNGMASWQTSLIYENETDRQYDYRNIHSFLNPLTWNQALSDTWQLTWTPLPIYVSHQLSRDESGYWGISVGSGFGLSSNDGWVLTPMVNVTKRSKLGTDFALDTTLATSFQLPFGSERREFTWEAGVVASPLYQVSNHWMVGPVVGVYSRDEVVIDIDFSRNDFIRRGHQRKTRVPLGATTKWLLSKQWELSADYLYHRLGYDAGYTLHQASVTATHYW